MLPTAYEFHWDTGHIVFLGVFYSVLTVVMGTLVMAALRARRDMNRKREADIAWHESFSELASERRHCRHEFDGTFDAKVCGHEFACGNCEQHRALAAAAGGCDTAGPAKAPAAAAPAAPADTRLYHRGHTWVEARPDGTYDVGVDDLLRSCVGNPDRVTVPGVGTRLLAGTPAADLQRGHVHARVSAPIAGTVVAVGDYEGGRLFRVRPDDGPSRIDQLLRETEARVWMMRELELLQSRLARPDEAPALADGGELVHDLMGAYPDADWESILADLCLEP